MNQAILRWLSNELMSARDRTELNLACRGTTAALRRRCSPYVSHREVIFGSCDYDDSLFVRFRDGDEGIAIYAGSDAPKERYEEDAARWVADEPHLVAEAHQVPCVMLNRFLTDLNRETGGLTPTCPDFGVVWIVVIRRRVVGYQKVEAGYHGIDGEKMVPIFAECEPSEVLVSPIVHDAVTPVHSTVVVE